MKKVVIIDIVALLLMVLFVYTGINKLLGNSVFKAELQESPILRHLATPIAGLLPALEILIGFALLIPRTRLRALYLSVLLLIAFSIYIVSILTLDSAVPCSCGGIISLLSWPLHLILNGLLIVLGIISILLEKKRISRMKIIPS